MKLHNLLIIFLVIALPVIIILSVYINYQIDTANLKADYTSRLLKATHDTVATFQLNTTNNKYSTVSDSLIRDIDAALNTFSMSLATNFRLSGTSKNYAMAYVPAVLFTLYDGYYIYTPTALDNGTFEHSLKPYVYYTEEYRNGDKKVVINFSLDNYVAVYYYEHDRLYHSKAGYLEIVDDKGGIEKSGDQIKYKDQIIDRNETLYRKTYTFELDSNGYVIKEPNTFSNLNHSIDKENTKAYEYYRDAYEFTKWYNGIIDNLNMQDKENLKITKTNSPLPEQSSYFNDEKNDVIKDSITSNLIQAMEIFSQHVDEEFKMPKLTGKDWYTILNNICVLTFMQGVPCGTTKYSDYIIMPSTENEQYISEKSIYYIGYERKANPDGSFRYDSNGTYHRIGCPKLEGDLFVRI